MVKAPADPAVVELRHNSVDDPYPFEVVVALIYRPWVDVDESACNYNQCATWPDGSCFYENELGNCIDTCLADVNANECRRQ